MQIFTVPLKEKMFFLEHMHVMLKASIGLDRALSSLAEQTKSKQFRAVLDDLKEGIKRGEQLSEGMARHRHVFSDFFINMVKAGEISGKLEDALKRLYLQVKKDYDLRAKVKGALAYPTFVVVAMIGIGTAMFVFVIPKLITVFEGFDAELPLATRFLIAVSNFVAGNIIALLIGGALILTLLIWLIKTKLRMQWHTLLTFIPLMSGFIKKINLARFSRTLSTLLGTNILVVEALTITSKVLGNSLYKKTLLIAAEQVAKGIGIGATLKRYPRLFPATVITMVSVGEESGTLSDLLGEVAQFYEESVDEMTKTFASIIEPLLIVLLGLGVGGIALAILTPMYSLVQQI